MTKLLNQSGLIHTLPLLVIIAAVGIISFLLISSTLPINGLFGLLNPKPQSHAVATLTVTGVAADHSAAKIYFNPVPGAKDYRIYDITNPNNVKYAGLIRLTPNGECPGYTCFQHFVLQADGVTPVYPYQVTGSYSDGGTGTQVLDVPQTQIDYNGLGDGKQHTLVVEAVDQLGPVPHANLYDGANLKPNIPLVSPLPTSAMLGGNKGPTDDGKTSTNGQGPFTNNPQVLAQSQPFVVQANQNYKAIPSKSTVTQTFFDTFDNSEMPTLKQTARNDNFNDSFGNLGMMNFTLNAGTPKAWDILYRSANNKDSMPFISSDHFMDVLFDGATPGVSAPTHTTYSSMSMIPSQTIDISNGKVLHLTMEVDSHQSFRRWMDFNLTPASDPLQRFDFNNLPINNTNQGLFLEMRDFSCDLSIFTGPPSNAKPAKTGSVPFNCDRSKLFVTKNLTHNGIGLDNKSRFDLFVSSTHIALFQDGQFITQADIPAGSFPWANQPLKAYFTHYVYHSDAEFSELSSFDINGQFMCYPLNSYWYNNPLLGTTASQTKCNIASPPGYGFPYSDERHWDNMGFEVLPASDIPTNNDFSLFSSLVQLPQTQAPQFATSSPTPSLTPGPSTTSSPSASVSSCPKGPLGDIDCDGKIGIFDYNVLVGNFGK